MHRLSESESDVAQSCPTLCDPVDCSRPCSSIYGIFQARILEWVAISFSRGPSQPRDWTRVAHIVSRCFTVWATREVLAWIWKCRVRWGDPRVHLFFSTHSSRLSPSPSTGPSRLLAVHPPLLLPLTPLLCIHCADFYPCECKCCRL